MSDKVAPALGPIGLGDKFSAVLVGPDGKLKQTIGLHQKGKFCPCCGEAIIEVVIRYCTTCTHRYMVSSQAQDGKLVPVIIDLGEEREQK